MTKTVGQWVNQIEEVVGSVQNELQRSMLDKQREFSSLREEILMMSKQLAMVLNQRVESAPSGSMTTEKLKEKTGEGGYCPTVDGTSGGFGDS